MKQMKLACETATIVILIFYAMTNPIASLYSFIDSIFLVIILVPLSSPWMIQSEIVLLTIANWTAYQAHTMSART